MDSMTEFDLGPLTWVKGEIDNAFTAAATELQGWNGQDLTPLKVASAHLHQVYGALQIVDLQGVSLVCGECEALLADMQADAERRTPAAAETVLKAIQGLRAYLDSLMNGAPNAEIALMPLLGELHVRRGMDQPPPSELFYPDLSVRATRSAPEFQLADADRTRALRTARAAYQKGLLQVLQGKDVSVGLRKMADALAEVERLAPGSAQYTFWWAATGLMDALGQSRLPLDFWLKRLCGRLDLQMRRLMEGSRQLADRLFRDVLYYLAKDGAREGRAAEARALFQLDRYLPPVQADAAAIEAHRPLLNALRDVVTSAKDHWMKVCAGKQENLATFKTATAKVLEAANKLDKAALVNLAGAVKSVGDQLSSASQAAQNEALQLEMATALVLIQNASEVYETLVDEFNTQADLQARRLAASIRPDFDGSTFPNIPLLDEISRQAQEKLLLAQVTHEIQANLSQVETILDKYFRDRNERGSLPLVPGLMKQVLGALNILQLDVAAQLAGVATERIGELAQPDRETTPDELNWVADAISTLGLYVEALRNGRDDISGLNALLAGPEEAEEEKETSVEEALRGRADQLLQAVERWAAGDDSVARDEIRAGLQELARDADLVGDQALRKQVDSTLEMLNKEAAVEQVQASVQSLAGPAGEAVAPTPEAARMVEASAQEIDDELLQIYLEEAKEVLGTVTEQLAALRSNMHDHEAFVAIRRGFHTLKGSGRMVGLTDPAEIAWEVEQTLNLWLREERPVGADVLGFVADAAKTFGGWVAELEQRGNVHAQAPDLVNRARALRGEPPLETPESTPPKADAGVAASEASAAPATSDADEPVAAGPEPAMEPAPVPPDDDSIAVGDHVLPAQLFSIFADEAGQRITALGMHLPELVGVHERQSWDDFMRAAHTLAGISRTTGFTPLAEAAHAVELWAKEWTAHGWALPESSVGVLDDIVSRLGGMVAGILERRFPEPMAGLSQTLADLKPVDEGRVPEVAATPFDSTGLERAEATPDIAGDMQAEELSAPLDELDIDDLTGPGAALESVGEAGSVAGVFPGPDLPGLPELTLEQEDALTSEPLEADVDLVEAGVAGLGLAELDLAGLALAESADIGPETAAAPVMEPESMAAPELDIALEMGTEGEASSEPEMPSPALSNLEAGPESPGGAALEMVVPEAGATGPELSEPFSTSEPELEITEGEDFPGGLLDMLDLIQPDTAAELPQPEPEAPMAADDGAGVPAAAGENLDDQAFALAMDAFAEFSAEPVVEPPLPEVDTRGAMAEPMMPETGPAAAAMPDVPQEPVAAPGRVAPIGREEELDPELLPIFLEEAEDLLPRLGESLRQWRADPADTAARHALQRVLHTLKGSARMAGAMKLGEAAHVLEDAMTELGEATPGEDFLDHLEQEYDRMAEAVDRLANPEAVFEPEPLAVPPEPEAIVFVPAAEPESAFLSQPELALEAEEHDAATLLPVHRAPIGREEELDPDLLPIFLEEAEDLVPRLSDSLRQWRIDPADGAARHALQRVLHTLKGSARMAGAMKLGEAAHVLEDALTELGEDTPQVAFMEALELECDRMAEAVERLRNPDAADVAHAEGAPAGPAASATGEAATVEMAVPELAAEATPAGVAGVPAITAEPRPEEAAPPRAVAALAAARAGAVSEDAATFRQAMRTKSGVLDNLINEAGEVSIARSRVENVLNGYKQTAQELTANVERLRAQLRELEIQAETQMRSHLAQVDESHFDPLEFDRYTRLQELTRLLAESVNDVSTVQDNLLSGLDEAEAALTHQSRMARSLQQELMSIRMVQLASQSERLYRIVRQAAKELGRKAQLRLEGGETELDRSILDKLSGPLEHLLRNSVAHGIEPPEARKQAGKPEYGQISLTARQEGNEIVLILADDGAGINLERIREKAIGLGWIKSDEDVSRERLESFLFQSGFTTAQQVTQVAGRGIGLDVVRSEIAGLGGRVRLDSEPGQGTQFTIRLPLTLAMTQVVLTRAGNQVFALPANMVVLVREVKEDELQRIQAAGFTELESRPYPVRSLAELTSQPQRPAEGRYRTLLLLRSGDDRLALRVDALLGNAEAVVKNIGPQLARIAGVAGVTVLGDGRVALILNPFALQERAPVETARPVVVEEARSESQAPLVLVVDDSLTVRKITSRLLLREGYRVATAKDGVEAIEFLQDEIPAVMLLDIEMPRMDGFEVTRAVRADPHLKSLPIIMITSRSADKHRQHALELGVSEYMGKPFQEEELLAAIASYSGQQVMA